MTEPVVGWKPHDGPQTTFVTSSVFDLGFGGAWGGSKTESLIMAPMQQADSPFMRVLLLRNTYPQLQQIIDRTHALFPQFGAKWVAAKNRWEFPAGGIYRFGYGANFQEIQQYLSDEYTYVGYDQVEQLAQEQTWSLLTGRIRSKDKGITRMARCTFNPGGPGHGWVRRRYVEACPWDGTPVWDEHGNSRGFIFADVYDNPTILENDPEYVNRIQSLPELLKRQAMGDWSAGEGVAFPKVTKTSHLVNRDLEPWWTYFGSFDWGYGHKWAFLLFANIGGGRIRVVDSVMGRREIPSEIAERVADLLRVYGQSFQTLQYTVAGADVKIRDEARGAFGPSVMEQFLMTGWPLMNGDPSRIAGYQNALWYLEKRGEEADTALLEIAPTAVNKKGVECLRALATDPDSPNVVLKVDYDPVSDNDGDDWYDAFKLGLMSRPITPNLRQVEPRETPDQSSLKAFKPRKETGVAWKTTMPRMQRAVGSRTEEV